ncbi:MAG: helix-turn-helix domain-containing protein [Chloroflexota bacterium]
MNDIPYEVSSGNVFADLGFTDPEEELVRADLAHRIATIIEDRGLTQVEAAAIMGINQPKVSALVRGRFNGFSFERLARYLIALGQDVEIVIRPTNDQGRLRVREESPA